MKKFIPVALVTLFTVSIAVAQTKKYDLKSGIVTFETVVKMSGMTITTKSIVYFDDYGTKECKETYEDDGTVKDWFLSDGKDLYSVFFEKKEAYNRGKAYSGRGTEMRFDWNEVSEKDKQAGKYKKVPNVTVAGKICEAFELNDETGRTTFAGWSHITLLVDLTAGKMKTTTKAVKIEENAKVPIEKFKIPAGFALK